MWRLFAFGWCLQLLSCMRIEAPFQRLSLGDILDSRMSPAEDKRVRDVLVTAQGEMAIDAFLSKLRSYWETNTLSFSTYKGKCRLVKGTLVCKLCPGLSPLRCASLPWPLSFTPRRPSRFVIPHWFSSLLHFSMHSFVLV